MRHLKRSLGFLAVVVGATCAMPALATTWTNTGLTDGQVGTNPTSGNSGPCYTANQTGSDAQNCQFSITAGGQTIKVRAYSTISSTANTGFMRSAQIVNYTGGFGVTNATGDAGEVPATQPEHATDSQGAYEMLVFELPATGFDIDAFTLGWAQDLNTANQADVSVWFGGNNLGSDFNFSQACITSSGCTNSGSGATATGSLAYLGLSDVTSAINNPGGTAGDGGVNVPINTSMNVDGDQSGKYLVIAGALGQTDDYFKVKSITATPGTTVPVPGTLALLGLGLFGLVTLRRRPAFA